MLSINPYNKQSVYTVVSVIVVVFNNSDHLEKCLQRYRQISTHDKVELIIIDGGSTDRTLDVIKNNEDLIKYWISEKDNGIYDAMNKGILSSIGKYIIFVNSDDRIEATLFDHVVRYAENSNADIIACAARMTREGQQIFIRWPQNIDIGFFVRPLPFSHNATLISRTLYSRIGLYRTDYKIVSDLDFYYRAFFAKAFVETIDKIIVSSELTGFSGTQEELLEQENISVLQDYFPFLSREEVSLLTDIRAYIAGRDLEINNKFLLDFLNKYSDKENKLSDIIKTALDEKPTLFISEFYIELLKILPRNPKLRNEFQPFIPVESEQKIELITIGITAYNCEDTIRNTIDSIANQTWSNIEIIIVNDGSNDKTKKILDEFEYDNRIKVLHHTRNYGVASSRNHIISRARGKYIMFCDDDDISLPNRAEICLNQIKDVEKQFQSENVICFCSREIINLQNKKIYVRAAGVKFPIFGTDIDRLIYGNLARVAGIRGTLGNMDISIPRAVGAGVGMYPTKLLRAIGFHESFHRLEDLEFCLEASRTTSSIIITGVETPLYIQKMTTSKDKSKEKTAIFSILLTVFHCQRFSNYEISPNQVIQKYTAMISSKKQKSIQALLENIKELKDLEKRYEYKQDSHSSLSKEIQVGTLNTFDRGGAAQGSIRRITALRESGINATLHTLVKISSLNFVKPLIPRRSQNSAWNQVHQHSILRAKNEPGYCSREQFSLPYSVIDYRNYTELFATFDILHLHWVVGILDYQNAGDVLGDKPVVWTLADMNAFTGGCHYSQGCEGYQYECQKCPLLGGESNLAHEGWKIKQEAYSKIQNLEIICPSEWLAEKARKSSLLGSRPIHVIPNAFPTKYLTPINKTVARIKLGLPLHKKLILFGSDRLSNPRKGGDLFADSLKLLQKNSPDTEKIEVVVYGNHHIDLPLSVHSLGFLKTYEQLRLAYSACDAYIFPSREDNAPLTVGESMLCGTPVIAFPVGNVPDLITHKQNGYIAEYGNVLDLAAGIRWITENISKEDLLKMSLNCRVVAANYHSPTKAADRHISLYRKMLKSYL